MARKVSGRVQAEILPWPHIYMRPLGHTPDPIERWDLELITLEQAARIMGLQVSSLKFVYHTKLPSGKPRLQVYRVGEKIYTTRRDLHIYAVTRASTGRGSAHFKPLPDDYEGPPYTGWRREDLEREIEERRAEVQGIEWAQWASRVKKLTFPDDQAGLARDGGGPAHGPDAHPAGA